MFSHMDLPQNEKGFQICGFIHSTQIDMLSLF